MRAVIISVDFGDILAETLPRNRLFWSEILVVTTPWDKQTTEVAKDYGCQVHKTDSFYKGQVPFNKFLALEEGLDFFGRHGWIALVDADIIWPNFTTTYEFKKGYLYSFMRRRLLGVTQEIPPEKDWVNLPLDTQDPIRHHEIMGFSQVFHAADPHLGEPPWHRLDLPTAALGDSLFQQKWPLSKKVWVDTDCLHIGECARNWCGRVESYRDGTLPKHSKERDEQNRGHMQKLWPAKE